MTRFAPSVTALLAVLTAVAAAAPPLNTDFSQFAAVPSRATPVPEIRAAATLRGMNTWKALANGQSGASEECEGALTQLFNGFASCESTFQQIAGFFDAATRGLTDVQQQTALAAYCSSECRATALANLANVGQKCSARDIGQFESYASQHNGGGNGNGNNDTASDSFVLRYVQYFINLPCVRAEGDAGEFCLPAFGALVNLVSSKGENGRYQSEQLDPSQGGVCKPCAWKFFKALTQLATKKQMKQWRPIFLICMRDAPTGKFCLPEVQEVNAMPQGNREQQIAKYQRLCSTRCFQRWVTGSLVFGLVEDNAELRRAAKALLEKVDSVCQRNEREEFCAPKWEGLPDKIAAGASNHGCDYASILTGGQCSQSCGAYIQTEIVDDLACCFNSWLRLRQRYGDLPRFNVPTDRIMRYINTTCGVEVPRECSRPSRKARLVLRLRNIAWSWVVQNTRKFWEAIRADVSTYLGSCVDDVEGSDGDSGSAQLESVYQRLHMNSPFAKPSFKRFDVTSANGRPHTITMAPFYARSKGFAALEAGTSVDVTIGAEYDAGVTMIQSTGDVGMADGTFDLSASNSLPPEAYNDPSQGAQLDADIDDPNSAPGAEVPTLTVLAAITGATLLAAF